jgi:hypothetical protein
VVAALINKDIDGFLDMCEVPFHQPGGYFSEDKDDLRRWISKALDDESLSASVNEVQRIETFGAARAWLTKSRINSIKEVLADGDFVVHVVNVGGAFQRKRQYPLLIKVKGGKPRLAGRGMAEVLPRK